MRLVDEVNAVAGKLAPACNRGSSYTLRANSEVARVEAFRLVCGDDWLEIDVASGQLLELIVPTGTPGPRRSAMACGSFDAS